MESTKIMNSKRGMIMGNTMMGNDMMCNNMGMAMPTNQMNMMMMPRANMSMEKCEDGMKIMCTTTDESAAEMMKNLCSMLCGGMTSMCMMMNGMVMMNCNMMMGMCKYDMTNDGMCITWTSGDDMTCKMIQECCDCMVCMMECGCTTVMCMSNTPVCCC